MLVTKREIDYDYYSTGRDIDYEKPKATYRKKRKKSKLTYKLFIMGLAVIGLILSLFILYRYANITRVRQEITELERQKIELEKEKEYLTTELESIKSSSKIEEDAMIKLGMDYPTAEQVVYVNVGDIDMEEETDKREKSVLVKQFKSIVNLVLGLF